MKKGKLVALILAATTMCLATSIVGGAVTPAGYVVVAVDSLGDHLDPHRPPGNAAHMLMSIFDTVTRFDSDGSIQPSLATAWEVVGEKTWRFSLRHDVIFHNGETFDAEVVKANLDRMMNPDEPRASYSFKVIESYKVVDAYTIDITTVDSDPLLPYRMGGLFIAPMSMLDKPKSDEFSAHPVGTGPFVFVEWVPEERIVLRKNADYFAGAPTINGVTYKPIPEKATQISELLTGGVDIAMSIPPEFISTIEASGVASIQMVADMVNHVVMLRSDIDSPLSDKRVRQAMNYAVDVQLIIDTILSGYAHQEATVVHPFVFGYNPDVEPYPYDPDKARELLVAAGYADGFEIEFDVCPAVGDLNVMEVAQAVVAQLQEVGIQAHLNSVEYGAMRQKVLRENTVSPMFRWCWKTWYNDPDGVIQGLFHSSSIASFTRNDTLDELIMDARFNVDQADREAIYKQIQVILKEEAPAIFLYYLDMLYAIGENVEWQPRVDGRLFFYEATVKGVG
jgi:peptide/nickel transport system substrate-binding protein